MTLDDINNIIELWYG